MLQGLLNRYTKRRKKKLETEINFEIDLELRYTRDAINEESVQTFFQEPYPDNKRANFESLFKEFENNIPKLLILGEPGSGKTFLLLEFALEILNQCKNDDNYPTPILLDVASWHNRDGKFENWLERNLVFVAGEFGTSKRYASDLLREDNLILLLDGLDEIEEEHRNSFLEALNEYIIKLENRVEKLSYPQMILSSRINEYRFTSGKSPVNACVIIEPLKEDIVLKQLDQIKGRNSAANKLAHKIRESHELAAILDTAFRVHIALTLAHSYNFYKVTWEEILSAYIERELARVELYHKEDATRYLKGLANNLSKSHKSVSFELSDITYDWLQYPLFYFIVQPFLTAYFLLNALQLVMGGDIRSGHNTQAIILGLLCSICSTIMYLIRKKRSIQYGTILSKRTRQKNIRIRVALIAIPWFILTGIWYKWYFLNDYFSSIGVAIGCISSAFLVDLFLFRWLPRVFIFLADNMDISKIQTEEVRRFSLKGFTIDKFKECFKHGFVNGFYIVFIYFIADFIFGLYSLFVTHTNGWTFTYEGNYRYEHPVVSSFNFWSFILAVLITGGAMGLARGFVNSFYEVTSLPKITKAYSRLRAQIKFEFIQWSILIFPMVFVTKVINPFQVAIVGYFIAFITSPFFKHLTIRIILFFERRFPFRLARFLNSASKTGLMENDGGLWRFKHQLIKNHFTSIN